MTADQRDSNHTPPPLTRDRVCRWLAIGLLALYVTSSSGGFETSDTVIRFMTAKSWLAGQHGELPRERGWAVGAISPVDGRVFTFYGPLQSVLMVPILLVLEAVPTRGDHSLLETFVISLVLFPLVSTLALVLVYRALRWLGYSEVESLLAAFALGLGSLFWHYARMGQEENLIGLAMAIWLLGVARLEAGRSNPCLLMALGGLVAICTRWAAASLLAVLGVASLALLWRYRARIQRPDLLAAAGAVALAIGGLLYYNQVRFGSPLETGYGLLYHALRMRMFQSEHYVEHVAALLFSPYRGLFVYSPVVLLGLAGSLLPARACLRILGATGVAACLGMLLFIASFHYWAGGHAWGPRFLAGVELLLAPGLARVFSRWPRSTLVLPLLIALQLTSTMLPESTEEYVRFNAERLHPGSCSEWYPSCTAVGQRIPRALAAVRNTLMNEPGSTSPGRPLVPAGPRLDTSDYRTLYSVAGANRLPLASLSGLGRTAHLHRRSCLRRRLLSARLAGNHPGHATAIRPCISQPMIGIAVLGAGHWGPNLIRNFHTHDECEVRWVVDRRRERREPRPEQLPGRRGGR